MPFPTNTPPLPEPADDEPAGNAPPAFIPELISAPPAATDPDFERFEGPEPPRWRTYLLHGGLFLLTLLTTTLAGVQLTRGGKEAVNFLPIGTWDLSLLGF